MGRVWPRHGGCGRPLNLVLRHRLERSDVDVVPFRDRTTGLLAIALLASTHLPGCGFLQPSEASSARNPIAAFLEGVEIQAEHEQQRNICRALQDLAMLPLAELRRSRYADYQGTPAKWDLQTLLSRHFVPDSMSKGLPEGEEFWTYVGAGSVRSSARRLHAAHACESQ